VIAKELILRRAAYVTLSVLVVASSAALLTVGLTAVLVPLGIIGGSWIWMALVIGLTLALSIILVVPVAPSWYRRLWAASSE
jgi:hypothetical protein